VAAEPVAGQPRIAKSDYARRIRCDGCAGRRSGLAAEVAELDDAGLSQRLDGDSDRFGRVGGTEAILQDWTQRGEIRSILLPEHAGKAMGLNRAIPEARGEVVLFTDVRQVIDAGAVRLLMENFADPQVGCASGELMLGSPEDGESAHGMGLYWRVEKKVRELESESGSTIGATGAIYAARRALLTELPADLILDDVFHPMSVVRQGFRVVFDPRAKAWDNPNLGSGREFWRKVRTLSGNYQLVQAAPWLLSWENPVLGDFVSHKLLRLLVPFALVGVLMSAAWIRGPFFDACLAAQLVFYALSLLALMHARMGIVGRVADVALTFVILNTAALVAFRNFVLGRKTVWGR
jgi:cellulose synthase/poly-beta-1,6-N-acetylglucosamine synthase-like glycosyltransferase